MIGATALAARGGRRASSAARACSRPPTATTVRVRDGERAAHRRAVRRDARAARRLLPARVRGPRRGARAGPRRSRAPRPAASRCARSWTTRRRAPRLRAAKRRRAAERPRDVLDRLFRRESGQAVAALARGARRPRPRRGGGPGRVTRSRSSAGRATACRRTRRRGSSRGAQPRARPDPRRAALRRAAREAIARLRRARAATDEPRSEEPVSPIADERLRLIFTCCHPALAPEARVALTLRALGGLTTAEVARAFLVSEPRWRSGSCAPSARSAPPASATSCRATPTCPARLGSRARDALPRLQRGLRGDGRRRADPARAVRRGDPARARARAR